MKKSQRDTESAYQELFVAIYRAPSFLPQTPRKAHQSQWRGQPRDTMGLTQDTPNQVAAIETAQRDRGVLPLHLAVRWGALESRGDLLEVPTNIFYGRIKKFLHDFVPSAKIESFGSFNTKLYLPNSDMDIVVHVIYLGVHRRIHLSKDALLESSQSTTRVQGQLRAGQPHHERQGAHHQVRRYW